MAGSAMTCCNLSIIMATFIRCLCVHVLNNASAVASSRESHEGFRSKHHTLMSNAPALDLFILNGVLQPNMDALDSIILDRRVAQDLAAKQQVGRNKSHTTLTSLCAQSFQQLSSACKTLQVLAPSS